MERNDNISSLALVLGIIGSLFIFASLQKIVGGTIALTGVLNGRDLADAIFLFIISWVTTLAILLFALRPVRVSYNFKISMRIGIVISSFLLPIVTVIFSPAILFGSMDFDIKADNIDILRNLTIGMFAVIVLWKWDSRHNA